MIVVDTSVWVSGFRGEPSVVAELGRLLDEDLVALTSPVRLELLEGSRRGEMGKLQRVLGALPTYVPTATAWQKVEYWIAIAGRAGHRFGVVDLLIGAVAREKNASVWSLDLDFERMAKLRFAKLHRPKGGRARPR